MNKKKYIFIGIGIVFVGAAGGVIHHFYPAMMSQVFMTQSGADDSVVVDPAQDNTPSDASDPNATAAYDGYSSPVNTVSSSSSEIAEATPPQNAEMDGGDDANTNTSDNTDNNTDDVQNSAPIISDGSSTMAASEDDSTSTDVSSSSLLLTSLPSVPCSFPSDVSSSEGAIIFNEIAWMGSVSSSNAEWMEIKNNSTSDLSLSGWEVTDRSGKIKIVFSAGDTIPAGGLLLLSRGSGGGTVSTANGKIYSGDLANSGDTLAIIDPQCDASDYLDASDGWPGGNNTTKQTLERDADGIGWHTSALPGGTPDAENSAGSPPVQYNLAIAFEGDAAGSITSDPPNLVCAASCTGSYASGTQVTLTPIAGKNAAFDGWSGLCYGQTTCSFVMSATTSITADFRSMLAVSSTEDSASGDENASSDAASTTAVSSTSDANTSNDTSSQSPSPSSTSTNNGTTSPNSSLTPVLIESVQISGASSSNDLVRLYNPNSTAIDMSGWKLHKKSQTGTDYSLKVFPTGSVIGAAGTFIWANATGGFSETVGANVSSTETLSADNSVALMDASGSIIDAVAWGTGTSQYGEGSPYPASPGANQVLTRQSSGGVLVNTENNASDFTLQ
jgi:Lamin Tail Domain/Divergent InlB B-repeat domain